MRRAAFLDRDGIIIRDRGYLADPAGVELVPGAVEALRALRAHGFLLVVVSNQSGLARGLIRPEQHALVHARVVALLGAENVTLHAAYYCPHGPTDGCACRKPAPGMLLQAAREHAIDLSTSIMIGDKASDVDAGRAAACRTAILGSARADADIRAADWSTLLSALGLASAPT